METRAFSEHPVNNLVVLEINCLSSAMRASCHRILLSLETFIILEIIYSPQKNSVPVLVNQAITTWFGLLYDFWLDLV